jgi:lipoic acid synthetase
MKNLTQIADYGSWESVYVELPVINYQRAWKLMTNLVRSRIDGSLTDNIIMCLEHNPVFTLGRRGGRENLFVSEEFLNQKQIDVVQVERGGNITFHGPGQIIVYPVIDLKAAGLDVTEYVACLEEIMIRVAREVGILAERHSLNRGVWVHGKKLGSVGVSVKRGIAFHGFALNVNLSLEPFSWINSCGLGKVEITTLENELSEEVSVASIRSIVKQQIEDVLKVKLFERDVAMLNALEIGKGSSKNKAASLKDKPKKICKQKPRWLKRSLPKGPEYERVKSLIRSNRLNTVCQKAKCPNQFECFSKQTATFLILGDRCTRTCKFCSIDSGPSCPPDPNEPDRVANAAKTMNLDYVVVTSVTRDDVPDGGAGLFAQTIKKIKARLPGALVEVLIPDFMGNTDLLQTVLNARPDVLNHNIETAKRLYSEVRSGADYQRSLKILETASRGTIPVLTKSGMMLGLGETPVEIEQTILDLYNSGCRALTLGQYLQPSKAHYPVQRFVRPDEFDMWCEKAKQIGFVDVASGPFVRSSYHAKDMYRRLISKFRAPESE